MDKDEDRDAIERIFASLDPEDRAAAIRVLDREALLTAPEVSSSGKKKVFPEEPLPKDSRRGMDEDVSTLSPAVQGLKVEYLVSLIMKKEPTVCQNNKRGLNQGGV